MFFVFCNSLLSMINARICRHPSLEAISFAATLPGLDEELVFRGILLAILIAAFGKPWRVLGVSVGWGAVAVICLFGVAHGYETASQGAPWLLACLIALISGMMGAMLLWIKERTGSIWLGVLVHNLANLAAALICS
jgi:membrane protease YdiL (CAAX protease family)